MKEINILPDRKTAFKNPRAITLDQGDRKIWINSVFGVNREGLLPARFLSGFLSSFGLAELIQTSSKGEVVPTVRVFIPQHISAFVNGIPSDTVEKQTEIGTSLLTALIKKRFPTVDVLFEKDRPISSDALEKLKQVTDLFLSSASGSQLQSLNQSGRNRGGEDGEKNAMIYAAHHSFGWSDLQFAAILEKKPPFTVINTLPPSEKPFIGIREIIKNHVLNSQAASLLCAGKRFDLVMMMSDRPHYLLITNPDGEILEPTVADLGLASSGEILDRLATRAKEDHSPWIRENLRRAKIDFERLLNTISRGQAVNHLNESLLGLLQGGNS